MRIAVLADVHGNLIALEAVLAHMQAAKPDLIVNLGDLVSGPFDPGGSADAQMGLACPTIAGNHERQISEGGTGALDTLARAHLSQAHLDWIARLPPSLSLADGRIFACHGSPAGGDTDYLLDNVSAGQPRLASEHAILARLSGIGDAEVVLCGHTHMPRIVSVGSVLIVNPGSVGMPGYSDSTPVPHIVEAGSPHARYAMVERLATGWAAELHAVPYDFEAAARQAERHGRPDVAHTVRTGRVLPE